MLVFDPVHGDAPVILPSLGAIHIVGMGETTVDSGWSTSGQPYRSTSHSVLQVLAGSARIEMDGTWTELRPGSLYLVPGHRQLRRSTSGFTHRWICITGATLAVDLHLARVARLPVFALRRQRPWVEALARIKAIAADPAHAELADLTLLHGMLLQVLGWMLTDVGSAPAGPNASSAIVGATLKWLDEHYRTTPSLPDLARIAGCSPSHLHACFSHALGLTPAAYAERLRMRDAQHLLTSSDVPVHEIARRCGYDDAFHFSRVVRRHFGRSPRAVRLHAP